MTARRGAGCRGAGCDGFVLVLCTGLCSWSCAWLQQERGSTRSGCVPWVLPSTTCNSCTLSQMSVIFRSLASRPPFPSATSASRRPGGLLLALTPQTRMPAHCGVTARQENGPKKGLKAASGRAALSSSARRCHTD